MRDRQVCVAVDKVNFIVAVDRKDVHGIMDQLCVVNIHIGQVPGIARLADAHAGGGIVLDL